MKEVNYRALNAFVMNGENIESYIEDLLNGTVLEDDLELKLNLRYKGKLFRIKCSIKGVEIISE